MIYTVRGPIMQDSLGMTLSHEHLNGNLMMILPRACILMKTTTKRYIRCYTLL